MKKILFFVFILVFIIILAIFKFKPQNFRLPLVSQNLKTELAQKLRVLPEEAEDFLIASVSGYRVFFSKEKDLDTQIKTLQIILKGSTIDPAVKEIDLRFAKPILR